MKPSKVIALACAVAMLLTLFGVRSSRKDTVAAPSPQRADSTAPTRKSFTITSASTTINPYWYDVHQGFEYAAKQLGVTVIRTGRRLGSAGSGRGS